VFALHVVTIGRVPTEGAADAKHRAAQAKDASVKSQLEQLAADWIALAEQTERIDSQKPPLQIENKT
jgi:hypothetical protein